MSFLFRPPPGWPRLVPPPGFVPGAGWPPVPEGWDFWSEERPHLVAVGIGLDVVAFLIVWVVTLGFSRLELKVMTATTTTAWLWLWIAGAGMGLTGAVLAGSPRWRFLGFGFLFGLPLPVLLGLFLTA